MSNCEDLMSASFSELSVDNMDTPAQEPESEQEKIVVFVSSRTFHVLPSLFEQVKDLPWSESGGYNHLDADPSHFEVILQFFLVGSLPGRVLVKQNKEALSQLVSHLGNDAADLKVCIDNGGGGRKGLRHRRTGSNSSFDSLKSLSRSNSNSSLGSVKKLLKSPLKSPFKTKKLETDDLLESVIAKLANPPLLDDETEISNGSQKENPTQQRWTLGNKSDSKKLHQEWCESEYIV